MEYLRSTDASNRSFHYLNFAREEIEEKNFSMIIFIRYVFDDFFEVKHA